MPGEAMPALSAWSHARTTTWSSVCRRWGRASPSFPPLSFSPSRWVRASKTSPVPSTLTPPRARPFLRRLSRRWGRGCTYKCGVSPDAEAGPWSFYTLSAMGGGDRESRSQMVPRLDLLGGVAAARFDLLQRGDQVGGFLCGEAEIA